ncbi:anthranilate synthase component I [Virgibacillus siamensis]|uniref:anthranilate synthase component I n=1 Tax=Virgibacillus siamensis TaxID=480071 RepID=UPI000987BD5B|nr:anthranilate synthase component I [Virgibacillus siamensis]
MHTKTIPCKFTEHNADMLTPIGIFNNLTGKKKFLLESSFQHEENGKFSFIGVNPYQEFTSNQDKTTVTNHDKKNTVSYNEPIVSVLQKIFPKSDLQLPFPFFGGAIGYLGYDTVRPFENIGDELPDEVNMADAHFMLYKDVIVFDHRKDKVYLVATNLDDQPEEELDNRLEQLEGALVPSATVNPADDVEIDFQPAIDKQEFMRQVEIAKDYINRGEVLQVVLSQRMKAAFDGDSFSLYRKLRNANPSPYMFYIDFEDYVLLGSSPESLLKSEEDRIVTNPIAGTRRRGGTRDEDQALVKDLITDKKEISEHQMLVDLSRNDFERVCTKDSITVPAYMHVKKYEHVMHMVSEVHGKLAAGYSSIDALIACLPAGTVSGAPRARAMQIINELENVRRGAYGGGVGYINFNYDLNFALTIRSLMINQNQAYLQAGAGIVKESDPEKEYYETLNKAKSLMEIKNEG